jgi:hypothetical protein
MKQWYSQLMFGLGALTGMTAMGLTAVLAVAMLAGVMVGAWDLLVWLTKSNWRTTNFEIPAYSLAVAGIAFVCAKMFANISLWFSRMHERAEEKRTDSV